MSLHAQNPLSKVPLLNSVSTVHMWNVSSQWFSSHSLSRLASHTVFICLTPPANPFLLYHHNCSTILFSCPWRSCIIPMILLLAFTQANMHTHTPHTGILAHACTQMQVLNKWKILLIWFWYQCNLASRAGLAVYLPMQWDSRRGTSASSSLKVW